MMRVMVPLTHHRTDPIGLRPLYESPGGRRVHIGGGVEEMETGEENTRKEETVKLISAEGFEFVIDKKAAMVTFPEISTPILEKICQYFYWSLEYSRLPSFPL
ncbi:hypothetical protein BHE74_00010259 [Ensete ventricosum]|uniref:Uncharacterized protein n=1 Tax=Ensete ventricosum TaxID=4639 RepID=A0A444FQ85_ENSVE|nr:hypothetical protein GW17_00010933 [Ensete ventricosum]RWW81365.1 hypothetical protein BHE74_00010259 [Ensete ventricosum]RZR73091.1 hypothetical protein BHM03_00019818 [Ensete ventricosum]